MELTLSARRWYDLRSIAKPVAKLEEIQQTRSCGRVHETTRTLAAAAQGIPIVRRPHCSHPASDRGLVSVVPLWQTTPHRRFVIEASVDIARRL
jgi:hypothetical protein